MKRVLLLQCALLLLVLGGCRRAKEITSLQRKEAATLASEAEFAMSIRDLARAEETLAKMVTLCPDTGDYWINLGSVRMRLGKRESAKSAYESALDVYKQAAKLEAKEGTLVLQQIYVLALLGKTEDAKKLLEKTQKKLPDDRAIRAFVQERQFERLLADPGFKEISL
jgi:Flp pilus assembly protein TadD